MLLRKYIVKTAHVGFVSCFPILYCTFRQPSRVRQAGSEVFLNKGRPWSHRSEVVLVATALWFLLLNPGEWWLAEEPLFMPSRSKKTSLSWRTLIFDTASGLDFQFPKRNAFPSKNNIIWSGPMEGKRPWPQSSVRKACVPGRDITE